MKKIFAFIQMARLLYSKFFIAESPHDSFPVVELGPFEGSGETYSLVMLSPGEYPKHAHKESDARFMFHSGEGIVCLEHMDIPFKAGTVVDVPRNTPHGFHVKKRGVFIVWQSKPITSMDGTRDVYYFF